jgi:hypothetical protein
MSIPINACLVVKATHDEQAYQEFLRRMRVNLPKGSMTNFPCQCDPPCTASDEAIEKLEERLATDLNTWQTQHRRRYPRGRRRYFQQLRSREGNKFPSERRLPKLSMLW